MKKRTKIIFGILILIIISIGYFAYQTYQMVMGSEKISGIIEDVPKPITDIFPELSFGEDDWPHWRGINLDGKSNAVGIKTDWSSAYEKLWQVDYLCQDNATGSWSSVAVQGNRLVVPGRDELNDLIFCLNSETGELIWSGSYEAVALTPHGKGSRATPFIDNERVYTFGRSGDLVCWNLYDGSLLWKQNVVELGGIEPNWGYSISPFVFENKVIIQGGGDALIIAYDKINGDVIWKSLTGKAGFSSATPIEIDNEVFLLIYHGEGLSLIDPSNGNELWNIPWETDHGVNATTPIVDQNLVFFTAGYGMGSQAIIASKTKYETIWINPDFSAQHSDPILIDGFLYGYSGQSTRNKGEFKCIELASGKEMWSTKDIGNGTTIYVDGYLLCMDYKTNLFLIEPAPSGFKLVGKIETAIENVRHLAWTSPVIANGKLYVRYLQTLSCFNIMP